MALILSNNVLELNMKRILLSNGSLMSTALTIANIKDIDYIYLVNHGQPDLNEQYNNLTSAVAKLSMPYPLVNYQILKCVELDKAKLLGVLAVAIDKAMEQFENEEIEFILAVCTDDIITLGDNNYFINLARLCSGTTNDTVKVVYPFLEKDMDKAHAVEFALSKLNTYLNEGCYGATPDVLWASATEEELSLYEAHHD